MSLEILQVIDKEQFAVPFAQAGVRAGFPSPAQDYMLDSIDLTTALVNHPATTFCARVDGDSMVDANVYDGDILVVDRSLEPANGNMAVCFIDGEFTLKYIDIRKDGLYLRPANPDYPDIKVESESEFRVWGIVTYSIHRH